MIQDPIILSMHFIKLPKGFLKTPQEGILNYANRNLIAFTEFGDRPLLVVYDLEQAWIQSLVLGLRLVNYYQSCAFIGKNQLTSCQYNLHQRKKLKLLRCAEFKSHDVVSLAFSHDSKYILVQGGHPDFQLVYFFWEKGKVITSISRVVSQV